MSNDNGKQLRPTGRDYCQECDPGRMVQGHERRLLGLETREGAAVADTRATRNEMCELRTEIGGYLRTLSEHINELRGETRARLDAIEETVAELVEAIWSAT